MRAMVRTQEHGGSEGSSAGNALTIYAWGPESDPSNHVKALSMAVHTCNLNFGEAEAGGSLGRDGQPG